MRHTEKNTPARPGSVLARERAQIRATYKPSAREVFQIALDLARLAVRGDE